MQWLRGNLRSVLEFTPGREPTEASSRPAELPSWLSTGAVIPALPRGGAGAGGGPLPSGKEREHAADWWDPVPET